MSIKKPEIPTPVKVIDRILEALYKAQSLNYEHIKKNSGTKDDEDTERSIIKLYEDGYILIKDTVVENLTQSNVRSYNFMIPFNGVIHHLKNGYEGEITNVFLERNLNQQVIADQKSLAGRMNLLTFVLIVVSFPTCCLALADLWSNYHWFRIPLWWSVGIANVFLSALTIYTVIRLLKWKQSKRLKAQTK